MTEGPGHAGGLAVRQAGQADVTSLVALYQEAQAELSGLRGGHLLIGLGGRGTGEAEARATFARQLSEPGWRVVVGAVRGGHFREAEGIVGYGSCTLLSAGEGELVGSIEELYVRPAARRSGLGRAIASSLITWCTERGCSGVDAKALPGSRAVKSFFEGEGFTARLLVMHRRL